MWSSYQWCQLTCKQLVLKSFVRVIMDKSDISKFENRFPSLENATNFIKKLKAIDLVNVSFEDIDNLINTFFELIPFATGSIAKGETLFRARINDNEKGFKSISELGLKPKELVTDFGRANRPNESVFYCSNNFGLACGEVLHNLMDARDRRDKLIITSVSEWETLIDLHITPVFYSEAIMKMREEVAAFKNNISYYFRSKGLFKTETLDVSDLILEFFCDEFSKNIIKTPNDYKYSVWYVWKLKRGNDLIHQKFNKNKSDGVVYPGVAMNYKGDNIALFDSDLETKIKFKTAYELICTNFEFENSKFSYAKIRAMDSFDINGKLKWKDV